MMTDFTDAARRCCGLSARLLGWRPDEFWRATPADLAIVLEGLSDPASPPPPSRETIGRMMERDER